MMTTQDLDQDIEYADDPLEFWDQRIKASRWMIAKTMALGLAAAGVAVLGQGWLEDASPFFPVIKQNYGIWQGGYVLALIAVFLLWAAAMQQKLGFLHNSRLGRQNQLLIIEQAERRAQRAQAAKERQLQKEAEPVSAISYFKAKARSNKFDY